jgi:hypothetical protein
MAQVSYVREATQFAEQTAHSLYKAQRQQNHQLSDIDDVWSTFDAFNQKFRQFETGDVAFVIIPVLVKIGEAFDDFDNVVY